MPNKESIPKHPDSTSVDKESTALKTLLAELEQGENSGKDEGWYSFEEYVEL